MIVINKLKYIVPIFLIALIFTSCKLYTIVPIEEGDGNKVSTISSGEKAVDVKKYIEEKWDAVFVPEINDRRQKLSDILLEVNKSNWEAVYEKGLKKGDIGAKYNFIVTDTALVKEVNTESRSGYIVITLDGVSTDYTIKLAIGPVLKGTAIRDSLKNINFNEFVNQMDYASLANELNKKANQDCIGSMDVATLNGKTIEFTGSFTEPQNTKEIFIMPIFMGVK